MGPLLFLTLTSLKNRTLVRVRRLKQPRYMLGTIVGLAYFWTLFLRPRYSRGGLAALSLSSNARDSLELAIAAFLFLFLTLAWLLPSKKRAALAFTQADVHFLFPAPLSRGELLRYKILRSLAAILFGSAIMTIFFRPGSLSGGWMTFTGVAFTMAILQLHGTGASLRRESLRSHGSAGLMHQWLPVGIVGGATLVLAGTLLLDWKTLASQVSLFGVLAELRRLATEGPAAVVLWPLRAVARLPLSESPAAFLRALPPVLLILVLNYFWVIRSDASFEEGSAEFAERIARFRKGQGLRPTVRKVRSSAPSPFTLSLDGRPEIAIFWKNLIKVGRYISLRAALRLLPLVVIVAMVSAGGRHRGLSEAFAALCAMIFVLTIFMGPLMARNDLRQDLANLAVLKTWPVSGTELVRGEVLAPAALLTVIAWFCALGGLIFSASIKMNPSWIVAAALLAPGVILLQLLGQNGLAVTWPSWFATGASRPRGIDVMGQRLLMMAAMLLMLIIVVVPAGLAGAAAIFGLYYIAGSSNAVIPAIVAAAVLLIEAYLISHAIGKLLDRTDISAIDATE